MAVVRLLGRNEMTISIYLYTGLMMEDAGTINSDVVMAIVSANGYFYQ